MLYLILLFDAIIFFIPLAQCVTVIMQFPNVEYIKASFCIY